MTEDLLKEISELKSQYDVAWDAMIKSSVASTHAQKAASEYDMKVFSFKSQLEKFTEKKLKEDEVVDKFCQLGDMVKERNRLSDAYTDIHKEYLENVKTVEKLKVKIQKAQKRFWKINGLSIEI